MTRNFINSIIIACSISLLTGCVTAKKHDDVVKQKLSLEKDKAECDESLKQAMTERKKLSDEVSKLSEANRKLVADTTQTGNILRKTQGLYNQLNDTYERLLTNHNRLLANSALESSKLAKDLEAREKDLKAREDELKTLDENLKKSREQTTQLTGDLKSREERLNELEAKLAEKDKAVNALKAKVTNALLGFNSKDLTVNVKNGKVYVSLAEQLLFKSGSTKVDPKGADALQKLAKALKDQADVNVLVEGHTDDVPVAKGTAGITDNWDLSVLRATEITRILVNAGLTGTRVTPSGRGQYVPLETAKTTEARQKNRRTEIILTPKLDELFQMLESN
jgi:chemotaxis protein MotB